MTIVRFSSFEKLNTNHLPGIRTNLGSENVLNLIEFGSFSCRNVAVNAVVNKLHDNINFKRAARKMVKLATMTGEMTTRGKNADETRNQSPLLAP